MFYTKIIKYPILTNIIWDIINNYFNPSTIIAEMVEKLKIIINVVNKAVEPDTVEPVMVVNCAVVPETLLS